MTLRGNLGRAYCSCLLYEAMPLEPFPPEGQAKNFPFLRSEYLLIHLSSVRRQVKSRSLRSPFAYELKITMDTSDAIAVLANSLEALSIANDIIFWAHSDYVSPRVFCIATPS